MKMWSGRFEEPNDPEFEQWQRSFPYDKRLLPCEIAASKAHARALAAARIFTPSELNEVLRGLDSILKEGIPTADFPEIEDVHHYVEHRLSVLIGDTAFKLHTGRSRNEQIATDLRLYTRDKIDELSDLLLNLISALLDQAHRAGAATMPAYTHLQRAEPVLVAHWLLAYCEMFWRDADRLADCRRRMNRCPLGSGAIAGAILPLDRAAMAAELGFDAPTANSMDATSDRDFALEFVQSLSTMSVHLSRMAEDMLLYSTQEFGFVCLPERYSTGSSAMPQKKNADSMEILRSKAARISAQASFLLTTMKALPMAYNKDLQETQQPLFDAAEQCLAMLKIAAGFASCVTFNLARMANAATSGCMNAFAAAGHLVRYQGVTFRRAHEMVGAAVRKCIESGGEIQDLSVEDLAACGIKADTAFYSALTVDSALAAHDVPGGTAPEQVVKAIKDLTQRLEQVRKRAHVENA
ncbi:MAG TPA: argininosuccinate lyase [Terriglobales bacterium]|nr:argininosuccinate lyase [Terriglobales bacterium]